MFFRKGRPCQTMNLLNEIAKDVMHLAISAPISQLQLLYMFGSSFSVKQFLPTSLLKIRVRDAAVPGSEVPCLGM